MPATPPTALARLGAWCFERRRRVLAGWVVALAIAIGVLGPLAGTCQDDFLTPGSDSAAADAVMQERFPDRSSMTIDVVWHAAAGAQSRGVRERVDALLAKAERLPAIGAATATEVSADGKTAIARLQIDERLEHQHDALAVVTADEPQPGLHARDAHVAAERHRHVVDAAELDVPGPRAAAHEFGEPRPVALHDRHSDDLEHPIGEPRLEARPGGSAGPTPPATATRPAARRARSRSGRAGARARAARAWARAARPSPPVA